MASFMQKVGKYSRKSCFVVLVLLLVAPNTSLCEDENIESIDITQDQENVQGQPSHDHESEQINYQDRLPERFRGVSIGDDAEGDESVEVEAAQKESVSENKDHASNADRYERAGEEQEEILISDEASDIVPSTDESRLPERYQGVSIGGEEEEFMSDDRIDMKVESDEIKPRSQSQIPFWISPDYVKLIQPDINLNDTNINSLLYDKDFTSKLLTHNDIPEDIKDFVKTQNNPVMEAVVPPQTKKSSYNRLNGKSRAVTWKEMFGLSGNNSPLGITSSMSDDIEFLDSSIDGVERSPRKVKCYPKKLSVNDTGESVVKILNSTELMDLLGKKNDTVSNNCAVVLFFAPWCPFSANAAPHFNALARSFKNLDIIAIDAVHFNKFGTVAVPNILVFHNSKAVARFNGTERTLEFMFAFVENVTAIEGNKSVVVLPQDYEGPLSSTPTDEIDYYLIMSWIFIISFCISQIVRSNTSQRIMTLLWKIGNIEHQHID